MSTAGDGKRRRAAAYERGFKAGRESTASTAASAPAQLNWIVGGISTATYAAAFENPRFYSIAGREGDWTLSHPKGGTLFVLEGLETQIAARRAAQAHFDCVILAGMSPAEAASPAPHEHLRVEPLKWSQDRKAKVLGATWMVWPYPDPLNDGLGNWLWQVVDAYPHASGRFHSEAEAKAAAEADYEARILSFIATTEGQP